MSKESQNPYALIDVLTLKVIDEHHKMRPSYYVGYSAADNEHCIRDNHYHFTFLFDAASLDAPELFINYVAWARILFKHLNIQPEIFLEKIKLIQNVCRMELQEPFAGQVDRIIQQTIDQFSDMPDAVPSFINEDGIAGIMATEYLRAILRSDRYEAQKIIHNARANGLDVKDIYISIFQQVQYEVGRQWQHRQISVAQEHYATAVSQQLMAQIYPSILALGVTKGSIIVACIGNELHEMGARMVSDFLEMDGWDVSYLGSNTPSASIMAYMKQRKAKMLMISATMCQNVKNVRDLVNAVRSDAQLKEVKIIVGGYPFNQTPSLWRSVGADGYAKDAREAVNVANGLSSKE